MHTLADTLSGSAVRSDPIRLPDVGPQADPSAAAPGFETTDIVSSFFTRLECIEEIVRVFMGHARLSTLLTFRGTPEKRVLMDFARSPARVSVVNGSKPANVLVTVKGEVMHEILLGRMPPGVALGRRELLLKGKVSDLARIIPLFDIAPVLYREHLSDVGHPEGARRAGTPAAVEGTMSDQIVSGAPIGLVELSGGERLAATVMSKLAYLMGYAVGLLRYRLFKKLNLFEVLSAMARGLAAADPTRKAPSRSPESGTT
jgi:hypothetical protein